MDDPELMAAALEEARRAAGRGEVPVGAVVASNGEIIARAGNEREGTGDPTAHAEILALRRASEVLGSWRLTDASLYVTLEPCSMCGGALVAARLGRLVFATPDLKAGACGSLYNLCADPRLNHEIPITSGVLADEASQLLSTWFAGQRARPAGPGTRPADPR